MTAKVPDEVREKVTEIVFKMADEHCYLEKDRQANSNFMGQLIADPKIGGVLGSYIPKDKVKTYIKDALLNRYSKIKRARPEEIDHILTPHFGVMDGAIDYDSKNDVSLHKLKGNALVFAARVGYLKWETGLRRLILFAAKCKAKAPEKIKNVSFALLIFIDKKHINSSDKLQVETALKLINVVPFWV